jgi:hypothetical protein
MQGIYTYIPETNHVPREYIVAAILLLLFVVPISLVCALALLYFYVSTFRIIIIIIIIITSRTIGGSGSYLGVSVFLGCDAASLGIWFPTFRDSVVA